MRLGAVGWAILRSGSEEKAMGAEGSVGCGCGLRFEASSGGVGRVEKTNPNWGGGGFERTRPVDEMDRGRFCALKLFA